MWPNAAFPGIVLKLSPMHRELYAEFTFEPWHEISNNLTSVDSDEPVLPPLKLRISKRCSVSSLTLIEYSSDEQRL